MKDTIYNLELYKFKKEIFEETRNKIFDASYSMKTNSNAYNTMMDLANYFQKEIFNYNEKIDIFLKEDKYYSNLKIDTKILASLFQLKEKLEVKTISDLLNIVCTNYMDMIKADEMQKVNPYLFNPEHNILFRKNNFYLSYYNGGPDLILYKLDDLKFYKDEEYLLTEEYIDKIIEGTRFYVSPRFTLKELNRFSLIWLE